jgi:hypothetical protein
VLLRMRLHLCWHGMLLLLLFCVLHRLRMLLLL